MLFSSQLNLTQKLEDYLSSVWLLSKSKISQVCNGFTQSQTSSRTQTPESHSESESSLDQSSISNFCSRSDLDPTLKRIGDALQQSIFYSSEFLRLPLDHQALCTRIERQADSLDLINQHSAIFPKKARNQLTIMVTDLLNLVCEMVDELYWDTKSLEMKVKAPFYGLKFSQPDFDLLEELSYADYVAYQSDSVGKTSDFIRMFGNVDLSSTQLPLLRSAADASSLMAHQSLRAIFAINAEGPHHLRIICFHAAGAICTERIDLRTSTNRFIEAMVCVLIKDPLQAGIDLKMSREGVVTPFGSYRVVKDFLNSPAYLGKSLRVCLLESQSELSTKPSSGEVPQRMVMKQIWNPRYSLETEAIRSVLKQTKKLPVFGLATWLKVENLKLPVSVYTSKKTKPSKLTEDDTEFFMSGLDTKELIQIPIYNTSETLTSSHPVKLPYLCNVRYFSRTVGIPLYHAAGFQQLVTAILHAAIGHHNLYKLGWVHRDISEGNVLLVSDQSPVQEPMRPLTNLDLSEISELFIETECTAFLHDLDLAYSYQKEKKMYQTEVKGTRGYLSIRLLEERANHDHHSKKFFIQNPIDDLESFLWLLIKTVYQIQKPKPTFTQSDLEMLKKLDHDCSDRLMLKNKLDFIQSFLNSKDQTQSQTQLSSISPIKPLIINLFNFFSIQNSKLQKLSKSKNSLNQLDVLVIESYKSFFNELISILPNLPKTWDF